MHMGQDDNDNKLPSDLSHFCPLLQDFQASLKIDVLTLPVPNTSLRHLEILSVQEFTTRDSVGLLDTPQRVNIALDRTISAIKHVMPHLSDLRSWASGACYLRNRNDSIWGALGEELAEKLRDNAIMQPPSKLGRYIELRDRIVEELCG